MSSSLFVVPITDLERGPKEVVWTLPEGWLRQAFADTDAAPAGDGEFDAQLTLSGREVVVQGTARVTVNMPDSITLEPVPVELSPDITLLLAPAPEAALRPRARRKRHPGKDTAAAKGGKPGKKKGKGGGWAEDPELSDQDANRDTYAGEQVVLDHFVREFLLLELPMTVHRSGLPLDESPAIAPPSVEPEVEPEADKPHPIDPRLAPLAAIASRLRQNKE